MGAGFSGFFSGLFGGKKKKSSKVGPKPTAAQEKAAARAAAKAAAGSEAAAKATAAAEKNAKKKKKSPPVNIDDVRSVLALYDGTDGGHWERRGGWRTSLPVPQWFGLRVDASRVVELALAANAIKGPLPAALGALVGLVKLGLNENAITGKLPDSLLQLKVSRTPLTICLLACVFVPFFNVSKIPVLLPGPRTPRPLVQRTHGASPS